MHCRWVVYRVNSMDLWLLWGLLQTVQASLNARQHPLWNTATRHEATSASICSVLERPIKRFVSRPSLKRISVGIPRMPKRGETEGFSSTLTLYTLASPARFRAAASTAGDMARQGPHQGAQKSTRIGSLDCSSSSSRADSLILRTYSLIRLPFRALFLQQYIDIRLYID